jgi:LTXXQ motif family protein
MRGLPRYLVVGASLLAAAALTSATLARGGGGPRGGGLVSLCRSSAALGGTLSRIDILLKTSGPQTAALEELREVVKENSETMSQVCAGGEALDFPARLAAAEKRLDAALAGNRKLEPVAEKFYGTLNERQKALVDELVIWPGQ